MIYENTEYKLSKCKIKHAHIGEFIFDNFTSKNKLYFRLSIIYPETIQLCSTNPYVSATRIIHKIKNINRSITLCVELHTGEKILLIKKS